MKYFCLFSPLSLFSQKPPFLRIFEKVCIEKGFDYCMEDERSERSKVKSSTPECAGMELSKHYISQ
jgi:hypothetical protein